MKRYQIIPAIIAVLAVAACVYAAEAVASAKNSIQPGRTFFGKVQSGTHPNRIVTLHNGTGANRRIRSISIAGSGGYVFTLASGPSQLEATGLPECRVGMILPAGSKCALDVRVHTVRVGWWRSVLQIMYRNGWNNSGSLEVHVVS